MRQMSQEFKRSMTKTLKVIVREFYLSPIAAVTNYYKFSGLKQHLFSYNTGGVRSLSESSGAKIKLLVTSSFWKI
jgi:hypothetical protein